MHEMNYRTCLRAKIVGYYYYLGLAFPLEGFLTPDNPLGNVSNS